MALADLTRDSVLSALAECDRMGRAAFLEKYGFHPARRYFLDHDGRRYDSKAIVGAAHGYLGPGFVALPASAFSGGDATVVPTLEGLGFEMSDHPVADDEDRTVRNPTWVRDELILALDLYMTNPEAPPGKKSRAVIELSDVLNRLGAQLGRDPEGTLVSAGVWWSIRLDDHEIGYAVTDGDETLVELHLIAGETGRLTSAFDALLQVCAVRRVLAKTFDSDLLFVALWVGNELSILSPD